MTITRRNLIKAGAGLAAGMWLYGRNPLMALEPDDFGSVLFSPTGINGADLGNVRLDCLWAFVTETGDGAASVKALSLEPKLRLQSSNLGGGTVTITIENVHGQSLQVLGAEVAARDTRSVELIAQVPSGGEIVIQTSLPVPPLPLHLMAASDTHLGVPQAEEHFNRVLDEINRRDALFILNVGDNVDEDNGKQWLRYRELMDLRSIPLFSTTGNHDSYFSDKRYMKSQGNLFYGFSYADALFLLMDNTQRYNKGTLYMSMGPKEAQWDWLPGAIGFEAEHKFAAMHFPVQGRRGMTHDEYLVGEPLDIREAEVERMMNLFRENGLDYLLYGHIHSPQRDVVDDMVFLRLGGGGGSLASSTSDHDIHVSHIFMDKDGIRDYSVFLYPPEQGIEGLQFLEAPAKVAVGDVIRPTVVGIGGEKLFGMEVDIRSQSPSLESIGQGRFKALSPGPATLLATFEGFTAEHSLEVV